MEGGKRKEKCIVDATALGLCVMIDLSTCFSAGELFDFHFHVSYFTLNSFDILQSSRQAK